MNQAWDWTTDASVAEGLPAAFTDSTYQPPTGPAVVNPLLSGTYVEGGETQETFRSPGTHSQRKQTADEAAAVADVDGFANFSEALATPHDDLHSVWVQGSMGDPTYAAYDPIFWAHHANVDRLWALWQLGPHNEDPDAATQARVLAPFGQTVGATIKFREDLHFTYAGLPMTPSLPAAAVEVPASPGPDGSFAVRRLRFNPLRQKVSLVLKGVMTHGGAFRLDVFVNQPEADANTPIEGNVHFAGSVGIFGMTMPHHGGGAMHHPPAVYERRLDITPTVAVFTRDQRDFTVKVVAKDMRGQPLPLSRVPVQGFSVRVE